MNFIESLASRGLISPPGGYSIGDWQDGIATQKNKSWWLPRAVHHLAIIGPLADGLIPHPEDPIRMVGFFVDPNRYSYIEGFDQWPGPKRIHWDVEDHRQKLKYDITLYSAPVFFSRVNECGFLACNWSETEDIFDSLFSPQHCQLIEGMVSAMIGDVMMSTLISREVARFAEVASGRFKTLGDIADRCPCIDEVNRIERQYRIPRSVTLKQVDRERYNRASRATNLIALLFERLDDQTLDRYLGLLVDGQKRDPRFVRRKQLGHDTWYRYQESRWALLSNLIGSGEWPKTYESDLVKRIYLGSRDRIKTKIVSLWGSQDRSEIRQFLQQVLDYGESHDYNGDRYDSHPDGANDAAAREPKSIDQ